MDKVRDVVNGLKKSYAMELESVQNYLANSIHLEGPPADKVKKVLENAAFSELQHARRLARRIKILGDRVPGSLELPRDQNYLQPPIDNRLSNRHPRSANGDRRSDRSLPGHDSNHRRPRLRHSGSLDRIAGRRAGAERLTESTVRVHFWRSMRKWDGTEAVPPWK